MTSKTPYLADNTDEKLDLVISIKAYYQERNLSVVKITECESYIELEMDSKRSLTRPDNIKIPWQTKFCQILMMVIFCLTSGHHERKQKLNV